MEIMHVVLLVNYQVEGLKFKIDASRNDIMDEVELNKSVSVSGTI